MIKIMSSHHENGNGHFGLELFGRVFVGVYPPLAKEVTDFQWRLQEVVIAVQKSRELIQHMKENKEALQSTVNRYVAWRA